MKYVHLSEGAMIVSDKNTDKHIMKAFYVFDIVLTQLEQVGTAQIQLQH